MSQQQPPIDSCQAKTIHEAAGNLIGLKEAIDQSGFDAILVATPENIRYVGDVAIPTQRNIRHRPAYILWPAGSDPVFIISESEQARVKRGSWIQRAYGYQEFLSTPMEILSQALTERGLARARLACELQFIPADYMMELARRLPEMRVCGCDEMLRRIRMVKTPRELAILSEGACATEKAILATFATAMAGEDERSLMRRLSDHIIQAGAERVPFVHIYGGANAAGPRMGPTDYKLRPGDLVNADAGGLFNSYISNIGRTAVVGKPAREDVETWHKLRTIHRRVIGMLKPGATGREIYVAAAEMYRREGLSLRHPNNGHGIGLEVHERPLIGPHEDLRYEPGMVTTVETRFRLESKSFHMEDLVLITDDAPVLVGGSFSNEELFVI